MSGVVVASIVGGIGNQLYCWASASATARRAGLDLELELSSYKNEPFGRVYVLPKLGIPNSQSSSFNRLERAAISAMAQVANRKHGHFSLAGRSIYTEAGGKLNREVLRGQLSGRCYLRGYWQSPLYFADYAGELRRAVRYKPCNSFQFSDDAICVHLRSFNEARSVVIGRLGRDYYEAAYRRCSARIARPRFVVYSDDLQWAEENSMLPEDYEVGSRTHAAECLNHDLCELLTMSRFKNFVIANSSFSWWAAYLSERSPWVIAPGRHRNAWFSEEPLPAEWEEA